MANLTNKNGTTAADIIDLTASGTYHANGGNDTINIKGGSIVVYTDSGNNIVNVTGGSGHTVKVAADEAAGDKINGIETLTVNGANIVDAVLGSGKDVIVLSNTNGKKTGALAAIRAGAWGDTFTVNSGAKNYQLYGDAGDDTFNIKGGDNILFWGGAANDTYNVTGGTNIKLRGGDSADTYNVAVDKVDMQLGYGNDVVNVTAGNNQTIKGNLGINTINLKAGSGHVITADIDQAASKKAGKNVGYGVDKVYITGTASNVTANLGDGKDVVEISAGSGHKIYTEGWGDTITVSGGSVDVLDAGAGDDAVNVDGGAVGSVEVGAGSDLISITDGTVKDISLDSGSNQVYVYGGSAESITTGADTDKIKVVGGTVDKVNGNGTSLDLRVQDTGEVKTIEITKGDAAITVTNKMGTELSVTGTSRVNAQLGNGSDVITLDTYGANEVHAGSANDFINATLDTSYIYFRTETKNAYSKLSGGSGNDKFTFSDSRHWTVQKGLIAFGGSGSDTFDMDCGDVIAYGGNGNDVFYNYMSDRSYNNYMVGGAGNDSYCFDLSTPMIYQHNIFNIDNEMYYKTTDRDRLQIKNFDGSIDDISLTMYDKGQKDYRRLILKDANGYECSIQIQGFSHLTQIQILYKGAEEWTDYGTGARFEETLARLGQTVSTGISSMDWSFTYRTYYGESIEAMYGSIDDFIKSDPDLQIYGNGREITKY